MRNTKLKRETVHEFLTTVLLKHEIRSNVGKIRLGQEWPEQRGTKDLQAQIECLTISSKCSRN